MRRSLHRSETIWQGNIKKTQVELEFEKKPELIAGFVLRVGDIEEDSVSGTA